MFSANNGEGTNQSESRDGAVLRALASYQCGLSLNPKPEVIVCGLNLCLTPLPSCPVPIFKAHNKRSSKKVKCFGQEHKTQWQWSVTEIMSATSRYDLIWLRWSKSQYLTFNKRLTLGWLFNWSNICYIYKLGRIWTNLKTSFTSLFSSWSFRMGSAPRTNWKTKTALLKTQQENIILPIINYYQVYLMLSQLSAPSQQSIYSMLLGI